MSKMVKIMQLIFQISIYYLVIPIFWVSFLCKLFGLILEGIAIEIVKKIK